MLRIRHIACAVALALTAPSVAMAQADVATDTTDAAVPTGAQFRQKLA